jgi:hypothetical protein
MEKLLRYSFRIQEHCGEFFGAAAEADHRRAPARRTLKTGEYVA